MPANPYPELPEIQRRFRDAVLGHDDGPLSPLVHAAHGSIDDRIGVYRATVQGSLTDVLAAAFPVTLRVVGEGFFAALARRFIAAAPPRAPELSVYGRDFAAFITHEDVGQRLPYLADVARLEWARGEAYFAADATPLDPARLAALPPDTINRLVLRWHPATRLIISDFPVHRIWEVNQPTVTDVPRVDMADKQSALVSRRGHQLITRALSPADAVFVAAMATGRNLGEAAELALGTNTAFDLQTALQDHFINATFQD